tara:strand:- start:6025 stop:6921 length:897 start_codon:yes stop_codon:yes gene_type:complete
VAASTHFGTAINKGVDMIFPPKANTNRVSQTAALGVLLLAFAACGEEKLVSIPQPDPELPMAPESDWEPDTPAPPPPPPPPPPPEEEEEEWCIVEESAFDIEEFSSLEDAFALAGVHDAIILDFEQPNLQTDETWRIKSVDVLAMVPDSMFNMFPDSYELVVEIYPGTSPNNATPYTKTQTLVLGDLEWETVTLNNPATAYERTQRRAWWTFDFGEDIPLTNAAYASYTIGVKWLSRSLPTVGYSNYNRACSSNWTNSGSGFRNNGDNHSAAEDMQCSWPMMRVQLEKRTYSEEICDE